MPPRTSGRRSCWLAIRIERLVRYGKRPTMKTLHVVFGMSLLIGTGLEIPGSRTTAQTAALKDPSSPTSELPKLTRDDARRVQALDNAIEIALKADRWNEAVTS